jgi:HEPN domain-containing protein
MYEQLSFHAQQAVEKSLKAILILKGIDFPKTHSIEFLLRLLPADVPRAPVLMQVYKLTGYATIFRYPGNEEQMTGDAYQELLTIARDTLAWAVIVINDLE